MTAPTWARVSGALLHRLSAVLHGGASSVSRRAVCVCTARRRSQCVPLAGSESCLATDGRSRRVRGLHDEGGTAARAAKAGALTGGLLQACTRGPFCAHASDAGLNTMGGLAEQQQDPGGLHQLCHAYLERLFVQRPPSSLTRPPSWRLCTCYQPTLCAPQRQLAV